MIESKKKVNFNKIDKEIKQWLEEYQGDMECLDGVILYDKLINEEVEELGEAEEKLKTDKSIENYVEKYDAIADIYWVCTAMIIFAEKLPVSTNHNEALKVFNKLNSCDIFLNAVKNEAPYEEQKLIYDCLKEVIRSNFSKSKDKQVDGEKIGKIVKGENYSAPNLTPFVEEHYKKHIKL